ncbi:MAG: tail fiber domain-containing protein [Chthoniobacterales bacterium]
MPAALVAVCLAVSPQAHATCNSIPCASGDNTYFGNSATTTPTGADNTAIGFDALFSNTSGIQNTAIGSQTLVSNTEGYNNTAVGKTALQSNTTAIDGTAVGVAALQLNTTGNFNVGIGLSALTQNSTGTFNTATGTSALYYNNGSYNTAVGGNASQLNASGSNNTAEGYNAMFNNTGSNNIGIGSSAGINLTNGSSNIDIGNSGVAGESNTTRIGVQGGTQGQTAAYIAGIYQEPVFGRALAVRVDSTGKLGTMAGSSARFKEAIKPMDKTSEAVYSLQPVTFCYKKELDPEKTPQFGLVAEQVEKVSRDLVEYDIQGKPDGIRYEAVDAMLLNEFLKEHRKVEQLGTTVAEQRKELEALTASVKEQSAQIQKVNAQLAADRPATRLVSVGH